MRPRREAARLSTGLGVSNGRGWVGGWVDCASGALPAQSSEEILLRPLLLEGQNGREGRGWVGDGFRGISVGSSTLSAPLPCPSWKRGMIKESIELQ